MSSARAQTVPQDTAVEPVDLVHLSRYASDEPALAREVLGLFCTQSSVYLARLAAASSAKEWQDAAHALKGSARAIGAWRVAEAAERAETLSGDALLAARNIQLGEIEAALHEAEAYIGALLKDRRALTCAWRSRWRGWSLTAN